MLSTVNMDKVKHFQKFDNIPKAITPVDNVKKALALLKYGKNLRKIIYIYFRV